MMNKLSVFLKAGLICSVFLLPVRNAKAQGDRWPVHYGKLIDDDAPVVKGVLLLQSGDTLSGWIKLLRFRKGYPLWPGPGSGVADVGLRQIRSMRLDIPFMKEDHTDFVNIGYKPYLWRRDGQKGDAAIYDNELNANGTLMILVKAGRIVKLYHKMAWVLHDGNVDPLLVKFIDKRYKLSLRETDFRTRQALIDFILDKEVPAPSAFRRRGTGYPLPRSNRDTTSQYSL